MTRLELEQFVAWRAEHGQVVGRHDSVTTDSVDERRVRHPQRHAVATPQTLDVRERCEKGRPVARDVDKSSLSRHVRAKVAARPLL